MKFLFVLLVVAAAAMADPDTVRERRGVLAGPLLAPSAAIITPGLGGAVLAGHGPALIGQKTIITGAPWGGAVVAPALWG